MPHPSEYKGQASMLYEQQPDEDLRMLPKKTSSGSLIQMYGTDRLGL